MQELSTGKTQGEPLSIRLPQVDQAFSTVNGPYWLLFIVSDGVFGPTPTVPLTSAGAQADCEQSDEAAVK
jgi:hypothetical protein